MRSRPNNIAFSILVFISACAVFVGATGEAQAREHRSGGRLIVQRAPNFGGNLVIRLSIDGMRVANIPRNHSYDGYVSAGRHVLTVLALPNSPFRRPGSTRVHIESGRTHVFTAGWDADQLVLRPSSLSPPTTQAPPAR
jgi:hypothetical protein